MVYHLFPFADVAKNSKIVLYGAGLVMRQYVDQLQVMSWCDILFAVDRNYADIVEYCNVKVFPPSQLQQTQFDYCIAAVSKENCNNVLTDIKALGLSEDRIVSANYAINTAAATSEALIVRGIFDLLEIKHPSYMDVGACDPLRGSNTEFFYRNGSNGINIEANPNLLTAFHLLRPKDINIGIGIAAAPGNMKFYVCNNKYRSSFDEENILRAIKEQPKMGLAITEVQDIAVETLNNIAERYNSGIFPDFLDLDIEGLDKEVLISCDFSKSSPMVICVEIGVDYMKELNAILAEKVTEYGTGFRPYCRLSVNTIYLRSDLYTRILAMT